VSLIGLYAFNATVQEYFNYIVRAVLLEE